MSKRGSTHTAWTTGRAGQFIRSDVASQEALGLGGVEGGRFCGGLVGVSLFHDAAAKVLTKLRLPAVDPESPRQTLV